MARLHEVCLPEIMAKLSELEPLKEDLDFRYRSDDVFLCALGFEDRCPIIAEAASRVESYRVSSCICFEYQTNISDNELNRQRLLGALKAISGKNVPTIDCDADEFVAELRTSLAQIMPRDRQARVAFDISACSSRVLISALTTLLGMNVDLRLFYVEADLYHPTREEVDEQMRAKDSNAGLETGVSRVIFSREHPGVRSVEVPEAVILFPTFKPERTRVVLAEIDEALLENKRERAVWVIGKPHLETDYWRAQAMKKINGISKNSKCYEVSTFDYRDTLRCLDSAYNAWRGRYNISISPIGSKLQCVGAALFWYMYQDVSFVFSTPESYNARLYSEGHKALWKLDIGPLTRIRELLDHVGQIIIVD